MTAAGTPHPRPHPRPRCQSGRDARAFAFRRAARIAARGLGAPFALILLRRKGQVSLLGSHGFDAGGQPDERALRPFMQAILENPAFAVADARADSVLSRSSLVMQPNGIRLAAGVSVVDADLEVTGAVWVLDTESRPAKPEMVAYLNDIAPLVVDQLAPAASEGRARRAETRLAEAVDAMADGFVYFDAEDRLVLCNERYRTIYARSAHAIRPGVRFEDMLRAGLANGQYPEAVGREEDWLAERLSHHRQSRSVVEQRLPDGQWLRIEEKQVGSGGRVGLRVDITELKCQQFALETARAELAQRNEDLERKVAERTATIAAQSAALEAALLHERQLAKAQRSFVAMVSHEFRTPLAIIDAAAGRVARRGTRAEIAWLADYTAQIRGAVQRLIHLIESVLGAAKADAGAIELKIAPLDIGAMIREICADQQQIAPDRSFDCAISRMDPVTGDPSLVYQILVNLIGNAVKYSPSGAPVRIATRMEEEDAVIDVTDRGVGIPEAEMPKMFGRFFRASTSVGTIGTGLGLTLSRDFAQMHGGDITIASREGEGSTFTLRLRAAGPPAAQVGGVAGGARRAAAQ